MRGEPSNKAMKLTRLSAAPGWFREHLTRGAASCPRRHETAGTASQLIASVGRTQVVARLYLHEPAGEPLPPSCPDKHVPIWGFLPIAYRAPDHAARGCPCANGQAAKARQDVDRRVCVRNRYADACRLGWSRTFRAPPEECRLR